MKLIIIIILIIFYKDIKESLKDLIIDLIRIIIIPIKIINRYVRSKRISKKFR